VGVSDGDTVSVLFDGGAIKVRLWGIDAPEKAQPFGERAKQFASAQAFDQTVRVRNYGRDRYGRTLGVVILPNGAELNTEMVRAGFAWWYRQYAPDAVELGELEQTARAARIGLWADAAPVAPWLWRKAKKR
jgi:endonuclease YncB( thermonuclease family)